MCLKYLVLQMTPPYIRRVFAYDLKIDKNRYILLLYMEFFFLVFDHAFRHTLKKLHFMK